MRETRPLWGRLTANLCKADYAVADPSISTAAAAVLWNLRHVWVMAVQINTCDMVCTFDCLSFTCFQSFDGYRSYSEVMLHITGHLMLSDVSGSNGYVFSVLSSNERIFGTCSQKLGIIHKSFDSYFKTSISIYSNSSIVKLTSCKLILVSNQSQYKLFLQIWRKNSWYVNVVN